MDVSLYFIYILKIKSVLLTHNMQRRWARNNSRKKPEIRIRLHRPEGEAVSSSGHLNTQAVFASCMYPNHVRLSPWSSSMFDIVRPGRQVQESCLHLASQGLWNLTIATCVTKTHTSKQEYGAHFTTRGRASGDPAPCLRFSTLLLAARGTQTRIFF